MRRTDPWKRAFETWSGIGPAAVASIAIFPKRFDVLPFQLDHVIPRKHGGPTNADNLALSCLSCNAHKGPNLAGLDPETGAVEPLFNPRDGVWSDNFAWDGPRLVGRTPTGRATIAVLAINEVARIEHRQLLMAAGGVFR
jgi:hypothetical protein